jgi:hypothetical protein
MSLSQSSTGADQCTECGAPRLPVSGSGSSKPPSYTICQHAWTCSERKPSWSDYLQRSLS